MAPLSASFSKLQRRLEKKTERKPAENSSPFASKPSAVIASLSPNYTLVFFRKLHCSTILSTITDGLNIYRIRTVMPSSGRHSVYPRQPSGLFFATFNAILQRSRVFTSVIASGNIQCAYSIKENSFRGLFVTPRAKAIPPKYINIIYEFCLARQRHDV